MLSPLGLSNENRLFAYCCKRKPPPQYREFYEKNLRYRWGRMSRCVISINNLNPINENFTINITDINIDTIFVLLYNGKNGHKFCFGGIYGV